MFLALDDTDGRDGGCTTYLLTRIVGTLGLDVIGFPKLVRLNPNIPYKTRGNAALAVRLGNGTGKEMEIGEFKGKPIYSFKDGTEPDEAEKILNLAWEIIESEANLEDPRTNSGLIVTNALPESEHYDQALREIVSLQDVKNYLQTSEMSFKFAKTGRGLVGALAALSWVPSARTYELIGYRLPRAKSYESETKLNAAGFVDEIPGTFNNIDWQRKHAAIFPSPNTPVQYGIRATEYDCLLDLPSKMKSRFGITHDAYMIFMTNQATDEQYISDPGNLEELRSYSLTARVATEPVHIAGGHWFFDAVYRARTYRVAVFEPTKNMRRLIPDLRNGDLIRIWASVKKNTLNLEKAVIVSRSRVFRRINPICGNCGARMVNHGQHDYRCSSCGNRESLPDYIELERGTDPDRFETPVSARRHLVASVGSEGEN